MSAGSVTDAAESAATILARLRAREETVRKRADILRERAAVAARLLAERFGARRIWLFGSLAWGGAHERSDVDLLVEGLPAHDWLRAIACVEEIVQVPVDVVRVEDAAQGLAERVTAHGLVLHDAR